MKRGYIYLFCLLQCFSCGKDAQVKAEIQALLDQCVLAVSTKNIDLYMEGIPDDFEIKDESGELITKEMQREYALRDWAIIDTTLANEYIVDSLEVFRDSAIVFTSQKWKRMMFQRDGITKDTVLTTQKHREIWKRKKSSWRNYHVEELGGEIFINGEKYEPQGH